ncbi:hypothetical protein [Herpetosiphon llansteffanensis]|uniref:hypothetical protein n=1 Tax=Herpetosiphon llansteffanensis TaxID=2094568 RepID=UPI000D7D139E|nr:hypothetical protein [Herpetosiphon llansteffanensis]
MRWLMYCWMLIVLLVGCTQADQASLTTKQFAIYIFDRAAINQFEGQNHNPTAALQTIDLAQASVVLTETDLLAYDWPQQQLRIRNPQGVLAKERPAEMDIEGFFVIVFNQQRIVLGRVHSNSTAMAADYPLLLDTIESYSTGEAISVYQLRANSATIRSDAPHAFPNADPAIAEAVKNHLRELGKLVE